MVNIEENGKNYKLKKEMRYIILCTLGALVFALNIKSFVNTGGLFPGGGAGITLLVQQIFETFFHVQVPYTAIYIPVNAIPIYIGIRYLGKRFTIYSVYVIILSSLITDMLPNMSITYDVLLIAIFGGIVNGIAISICLLAGASAGGTDFISIYLSQKKELMHGTISCCSMCAFWLQQGCCSVLTAPSTQLFSSSAPHRLSRCCLRDIRKIPC